MNELTEQIFWLAICIYHEARGESEQGQIAVGHVIMNRVNAKSLSVKTIVLKPYQFSWANSGRRPPIYDYLAFSDCFNSATRCLGERLSGENLLGADHYFADYIEAPKWSENMKFIKMIGKHLFFKS